MSTTSREQARRQALQAASPRRLLAVTWPLLVELALGIAVGVVGTVLAARLSDASAAAFALAGHLLAMLFILFRIVGAGIGVVITQSLGAGRRDRADAVARAAQGASSWIGLLAAVLALAAAAPLLRLLNAPAELLPLAAPLVMSLAPALLLDAWNASMAAVMRAHLRARDTLAVMVAMHGLHLALVGPAMFGLGPLPGLGLPGFALALALSRALALGLHLWLWRQRLGLRLAPRDWWALPRTELAAIARIGLPGAAENIAWRMAFMASVAAVALLGAPALAVHAYALQVSYGVLLVGLAIGLSAELVVGHLIGAGRLRAAYALVRRALALGFGVSFVVALAAALAGPWLMALFTRDAALAAQGAALLWWLLLLETGRSFNLIVINALRAAGDARYPVQVGAVSMAVVLAGGSWLLGLGLGWGLHGVMAAYALDEWLRGLLMWRRWQRGAWLPHARDSRRRAHANGG